MRLRRSLLMRWSVVGFLALAPVIAPPFAQAGIVRHLPFSPVSGLGRAHSTSGGWSGYATFRDGLRFTDVDGSWVQPAATCDSTAAYASVWIGLDGYGSSTVEQIGTEADCLGGSERSYAWYEMYPKYPVRISMKIAAGDLLVAQVSSRRTTFRLTLVDETTGESFTTKQPGPGAMHASAEWVVEASWGGDSYLPLTNFGTVQFTGCFATGSRLTGPIGNPAWSNDAITMGTGGIEKAVTSPLSQDGSAFFVAWAHA